MPNLNYLFLCKYSTFLLFLGDWKFGMEVYFHLHPLVSSAAFPSRTSFTLPRTATRGGWSYWTGREKSKLFMDWSWLTRSSVAEQVRFDRLRVFFSPAPAPTPAPATAPIKSRLWTIQKKFFTTYLLPD